LAKRRRPNPNPAIFEEVVPRELPKMHQQPGNSDRPDEYEQYSLSIVPTLRRIGTENPRKLAELKLQIQKLLLDAEFGE
jgi:hypothetical protein